MTDSLLVHASAVAVDGRGVLIRGRSGSGKSVLSLQLIAFGGTLVADDQVQLDISNGTLWLSRPQALPPKIEARGVGLLSTPMSPPVPLALVVDMDTTETSRHPDPALEMISSIAVKVIKKVDAPHFPAAILTYLRHNE